MEEKDDLLTSKYNMARKSQEQMFDVIDKGKYVKVKNVFTQLGLDTPDDMLIKIKEYEIKSDNLLSNNKTQEKKIVDVSDVIENKNITSTKTQIDFDYTKYKGACDILPLPSQGKIHPKNKEVLEVAFLTAIDESLFMQANLSKTKDIFNLILRNKIIDKDVDVNLLHHGDKNAILVFLRINAFGSDYVVIGQHPTTKEKVQATFDLTKIKIKTLSLDVNKNGYFEYKYVNQVNGNEDTIEFKFFNQYDEDEILKRIELDSNSEISNEDFYRTLQSIVSINGNSDRNYIESFLKYEMSIRDVRNYKKFVIDNEPGVDITQTIEKCNVINEDGSLGETREGFPFIFTIGLHFFE